MLWRLMNEAGDGHFQTAGECRLPGTCTGCSLGYIYNGFIVLYCTDGTGSVTLTRPDPEPNC